MFLNVDNEEGVWKSATKEHVLPDKPKLIPNKPADELVGVLLQEYLGGGRRDSRRGGG